MKNFHIGLIAIISVVLLSSLYLSDQPETITVTPYENTTCTQKLQIECAIEIERTVKACSKAIATQGADIIADIKCARDLMGDKKTCWPCICAEAKKKGWHVIGC